MSNNGHITVLLTGATGFVGNYVVNELLNMGIGVIATSRTNKRNI